LEQLASRDDSDMPAAMPLVMDNNPVGEHFGECLFTAAVALDQPAVASLASAQH